MAKTNMGIKALHLVKTSIGANWALRQMKELVKLGVEVHVALPPGGHLIIQYEQAGVVVHPMFLNFQFRKPWYWHMLIKKFQKLIHIVRPDIIHSHNVGPTILMRLSLRENWYVPRIFQVPGPLHLEHTLPRKIEILLSNKYDYWIGSCEYTCNLYKQFGIDKERIFLSYYGLDIKSYLESSYGKLREELRINKNINLVGMVAYSYAPKWFLGQTRGLKGHEDFIDALAICLKKKANLKGIIIGGQWDKLSYYNKIKEYGRKKCGNSLIFLGNRNDVPALYPDLDLVVHPSHSENVGGAVESLLSCVPTIATQVGGLPEVVKHGVTGWLVPPKKPEILAMTIMEALENIDEGREMAKKGKELVWTLFDVRKTAHEIVEIYKKILWRYS